jgi:AcrR family transcriptional regulator
VKGGICTENTARAVVPPRDAGVGSAVRRHFPTRRALLEAVSQERVEALGLRARELAEQHDSRSALLAWLDEVVGYCVAANEPAAALAYDYGDPVHGTACAAVLEAAAGPLLSRAAQDGGGRRGHRCGSHRARRRHRHGHGAPS